jgi:dihydroorotase
MPKPLLLANCRVVSDGRAFDGDVLIRRGRIHRIGGAIAAPKEVRVIDAKGRFLLPGFIDDQVHFRAPGLTRKADIKSESAAAVAGGVTSFMDMPNVRPPTLTAKLLRDKLALAKRDARANYAFYLGSSASNIEEIKKINPRIIAGVKVFMGSSTGDLLVDDEPTLRAIFRAAPTLIAVHCENTPRILANLAKARAKYKGKKVPMEMHPKIRDAAACFASSSQAIQIAEETGARLHILHITTAKELSLFNDSPPGDNKKITCEACAHHLFFSDADYKKLGAKIVCNPAIKSAADRAALRRALASGRIDVAASDHAPHLLGEKRGAYPPAAGLPMVQHSLLILLDLVRQNIITMPALARRIAHSVADIFAIKERGYIREGYWADLVLADMNKKTAVGKNNILYKCGWSPLSGYTFGASIALTLVSGEIAYQDGIINPAARGMPLQFMR